MSLTQLQQEMLAAGKFHVDGWTSHAGKQAAAGLHRLGLVSAIVHIGDQYSSISYTITQAGRDALTQQR